MTDAEERYYWDGIQRGKKDTSRNILGSVIKATTINVAVETLVWAIFCELIEQKVPTEDRKEKALEIFKEEVEKWS